MQDVVIAGRDRSHPTALILADALACGQLDAGEVKKVFAERLASLADKATGSSNRILAAMLLEEPPSLDANEMTDKGSINQRALLENRQALVEELYADPPTTRVIALTERN